VPAVMGWSNVQPGAAKRWNGATCQTGAPLSCSFFKHDEAYTGAKGPQVASADNSAKRFRAFIRQILFRKACARMDSGVRSADGSHSQD
jgi:hypothetical protein